MTEYLSFSEVASELKCSMSKVRQLVLEDRTLLATRFTPNGMEIETSGTDGLLPYDLDFCNHIIEDGSIATDFYKVQPSGKTELEKTQHAGFLRIERSNLARFIDLIPGYATSFTALGSASVTGGTDNDVTLLRKSPALTSPTAAVPMGAESQEQRQDRRLQACIDAKLPMFEQRAKTRLPDGVGSVADAEGVTRQAFSTDVKAALSRRSNKAKEGVTVHKA